MNERVVIQITVGDLKAHGCSNDVLIWYKGAGAPQWFTLPSDPETVASFFSREDLKVLDLTFEKYIPEDASEDTVVLLNYDNPFYGEGV